VDLTVATNSPLSHLPPGQILPALPKGVWFSACGDELEDSERAECDRYVQGLGFESIAVVHASDWERARTIASAPDWSREWWQCERNQERRLFDAAAARASTDVVLQRLTTLMEESAELFHGPASVACARSGIADPALARSAAGAASHALHQYGLVSLAQAGDEHAFAAKFRLFLAGRWPLSVNGQTFYIL
jgi:hypothetical protein